MSQSIRRGPRGVWRLGGLSVVLLAGAAWAQGTPVPLPGVPGGASPPIYSDPAASTQQRIEPPHRATPATAPEGTASPPAGPPPTLEAGKAPGSAPVPQITSFPELTRGVGNSEQLLAE